MPAKKRAIPVTVGCLDGRITESPIQLSRTKGTHFLSLLLPLCCPLLLPVINGRLPRLFNTFRPSVLFVRCGFNLQKTSYQTDQMLMHICLLRGLA